MPEPTCRAQMLRVLQGHIDGLEKSAAIYEQNRIASLAAARDAAAQRDAAREKATEFAVELALLRDELDVPDEDTNPATPPAAPEEDA